MSLLTHLYTIAMAPITEEAVSGLKDIIGKLETRVQDLEERLVNGSGKPKSIAEQMRIILMGPPGAGKWERGREVLVCVVVL